MKTRFFFFCAFAIAFCLLLAGAPAAPAKLRAPFPATLTIPIGGVDLVSTSTRPSFGVSGEALTSGAVVYIDAADNNELKLTDVTAEASATAVGIVLQDAADNNGVVYCGTGCELKNVSAVHGTWYLADSSGAIVSSIADLASGEYVTYVGYGNKAGNLVVHVVVTGETK